MSPHTPKKKNCFDFTFGTADLIIDLVLIIFTLTPQVSDLDERGAKPTDSKKLQGIQFTIWKALKITSAPRRGLDILFKDVHKKGIVTGRSYLGFSWGLGLARIIKGDGSNWGSPQFNDRLRQCMLSAILINHNKQWSK